MANDRLPPIGQPYQDRSSFNNLPPKDSTLRSFAKRMGRGAKAIGGAFIDPTQSQLFNEVSDSVNKITESLQKSQEEMNENLERMTELQEKTIEVLEDLSDGDDYSQDQIEEQRHNESINEFRKVEDYLYDQNKTLVSHKTWFEKELDSLRLKKAEIDRKKEYFELKGELRKFNKSDASRSAGDRALKKYLYDKYAQTLTNRGKEFQEFKKVSTWQEEIENKKLNIGEAQVDILSKILEMFTGVAYDFDVDRLSKSMVGANTKIANEMQWSTANAFKAMVKEQQKVRGSALNIFGIGTLATKARQKIFGESKQEKQLRLEASETEKQKLEMRNQEALSMQERFSQLVSPMSGGLSGLEIEANGAISVKVTNFKDMVIEQTKVHSLANQFNNRLLSDQTAGETLDFSNIGEGVKVKVNNIDEFKESLSATSREPEVITPQGSPAFRAEEIADAQREESEKQTKTLENIEDALIISNQLNKKDLEISKKQLKNMPGFFERAFSSITPWLIGGIPGMGLLGKSVNLLGKGVGKLGGLFTKGGRIGKMFQAISASMRLLARGKFVNSIKTLFGFGSKAMTGGNTLKAGGLLGKIPGLSKIGGFLSGATGKIGNFFKGIGTGIGKLPGVSKLVGLLGKIPGLTKVAKLGGKVLGKLALPLTILMGVWDFGKSFLDPKAVGAENTMYGKITAGLAGLASGLTLGFVSAKTIYKKVGELKDAILHPIDTLKSIFTKLWDSVAWIKDSVKGILTSVRGTGEFLVDWVSGMWSDVKGIVNTVKSLSGKVLRFMAGLLGLEKPMDSLLNGANWIAEKAWTIFWAPFDVIKMVAEGLYNQVNEGLKLADDIFEYVGSIPTRIKFVYDKTKKLFVELLTNAKDKAFYMVTAPFKFIFNSFGEIVSSIKDYFVSLIPKQKFMDGEFSVTVKSASNQVISLLTMPFKAILALFGAANLGKMGYEAVTTLYESLKEQLFNPIEFQKNIDYMKDKIGWVISAPFEMLKDLWDKINIVDIVKNKAAEVYNRLKTSIDNAVNKTKEIIANPIQTAKGAIWTVDSAELGDRAKQLKAEQEERDKQRRLQAIARGINQPLKQGLAFAPPTHHRDVANEFSFGNPSGGGLSGGTTDIGYSTTVSSGGSGDATPSGSIGGTETSDMNGMAISVPAGSGVITSPYGPRNVDDGSNPHRGIDFRGRVGDPAYSMAEGIVIKTNSDLGLIQIAHPNGLTTRYIHLDKINVKKDQKVFAGQRIGSIGKKKTKHPHLHFEVLEKGVKKDPLTFLKRTIPGYNPKFSFGGSQKSAQMRVAAAAAGSGGNFDIFKKSTSAPTPSSGDSSTSGLSGLSGDSSTSGLSGLSIVTTSPVGLEPTSNSTFAPPSSINVTKKTSTLTMVETEAKIQAQQEAKKKSEASQNVFIGGQSSGNASGTVSLDDMSTMSDDPYLAKFMDSNPVRP